MVRSRGPRNQRLAAEVYREALRPCFLTVRTHGYRAPFINADRNDAVVAVLLDERLQSHCRLYAFCLMPDHLHVLAAPDVDGASVLAFLDRFKGRSTNASWDCGWPSSIVPRHEGRFARRSPAGLSVHATAGG